MTASKLHRARAYEQKHTAEVAGTLPKFHVTAAVGWINDPNGFAPYKGEYHLFFQHHPYETHWGPMHWGHVKTTDFIKWERLPIAMAPDEEYDRNGCFSGGAVEMPDGRHLLIYTGVREEKRVDGTAECFQTQCVAIGDGVNYEKYAHNPVIRSEDIPENGSTVDFRDPKIWREDGVYYVVVGNRTPDGSGTVLLYRSEDGLHWEFVSKLASSHNEYGKMWECPDFFTLDGKHVLVISPQEMRSVGLEFHPGNANMCLIGTLDRSDYHLERESVQAIDYGLDFYAPQSLETNDGRRVMIGWMQNWETCVHRMPGQRFMGQMAIPRELCLRNGRLCQNPVRELENYRRDAMVHQNVSVRGAVTLPGVEGRFVDMTVTVRPDGDTMYERFCIEVACDDTHRTTFCYTPRSGLLRVDRGQSGVACDVVNMREFAVQQKNGELKLRFVMDKYSVELFVSDGEQAASSVIYTPLDAKGIRFVCDGAARVDVEKYNIEVE